MNEKVSEFDDYRYRMNELLLSKDNLLIKRIYSLDSQAFKSGSLDTKTKELLGLVASLVLRCDDCVKYHLSACKNEGVSTDELYETMGIGTLIGGTIVIPHLRKAAEFWEALHEKE